MKTGFHGKNKKPNTSSKILLTNANTCSILINSETQEDSSNHTNGVGSTSELDKSSLIHTHKFNAETAKNLNSRNAIVYIKTFFI